LYPGTHVIDTIITVPMHFYEKQTDSGGAFDGKERAIMSTNKLRDRSRVTTRSTDNISNQPSLSHN
jgi:hypothetical protein